VCDKEEGTIGKLLYCQAILLQRTVRISVTLEDFSDGDLSKGGKLGVPEKKNLTFLDSVLWSI
jgi:hypothetical protein